MAENSGEDEVVTESAEEDLDAAVEEEDEEAEEEVEEEKEPPVRKSAFFARGRIIKKQEREIEKLKGKGEEGGVDETELTPQARKLIESHLAPVVENLKSLTDEAELREYLSDHPEHKKYEASARKRMKAWTDVPVADIFKTLTYGKTDKAAEEEKKKATEKVKKGQMGGNSARATEETSLPTTQKDMQEAYKRVKRGETIKLS